MTGSVKSGEAFKLAGSSRISLPLIRAAVLSVTPPKLPPISH
jgi:hypothetical protein